MPFLLSGRASGEMRICVYFSVALDTMTVSLRACFFSRFFAGFGGVLPLSPSLTTSSTLCWTGPSGGRFVGLANYAALLGNPVFQRAAGSTSFLCDLPALILILSLAMAMMLNRVGKVLSALRMALILPLAVPVASVVLVWQIAFDLHGPVNLLLSPLGLPAVDWMNRPGARLVVLSIYLWKTSATT